MREEEERRGGEGREEKERKGSKRREGRGGE